jgi:sulfite dehydrogenase (cytochrome) subunit B
MRSILISVCTTLFLTGGALAQDENVPLKSGVGRETVEAYCGACHSLDYPRINSLFLDRQGWDAEVNKMIKAYGAPITPADATTIVDYLAANYGR